MWFFCLTVYRSVYMTWAHMLSQVHKHWTHLLLCRTPVSATIQVPLWIWTECYVLTWVFILPLAFSLYFTFPSLPFSCSFLLFIGETERQHWFTTHLPVTNVLGWSQEILTQHRSLMRVAGIQWVETSSLPLRFCTGRNLEPRVIRVKNWTQELWCGMWGS